MIPFHSRNKLYKSPVSAIATDEKVFLRITVPRSMYCSGVRLAVHKDGCETVRYSMFWAGMNGEAYEWWDLHFSATTPGLYWYRFELDTPSGIHEITNDRNGAGTFDFTGVDFQQTVYDKKFETPKWLSGGLIYQIFPDRFCCSGKEKKEVPSGRVLRGDWGAEPYWRPDENGKVLNNDYFGGDLKGIEEKLSYLSSLGVTCIYLNPIFESHSNHRYDTADYMKIDPLLGKEEDLKSLCSAARTRGIAVILDGVFSHTGCDSRYFNLYSRYDTLGAFNSQESPYYSWYKFIEWPHKYHSWWGIELLPEIQEEDSNFQRFIFGKEGVLRKWMDCGISGWRLDVADELPDCFLDNLRSCVKEKSRDAVIIGEVWEDATTKFAYGERRRYLLGQQLDSVMNYPFADAVLNFIKWGGGERFFSSIMSVVENYPPQALHVLMNHIGTHDTERAITRLAGADCAGRGREWQAGRMLSETEYQRGIKLLKLASLIQYLLPGVPSLYYGDEIGMQGYRDPFNRGCFDWKSGNEELLLWYRALGAVRKENAVLRDGEFTPVQSDENLIVFERSARGQCLLAAVNRGDTMCEVVLPHEWRASKSLLGSAAKAGILRLEALSGAVLVK